MFNSSKATVNDSAQIEMLMDEDNEEVQDSINSIMRERSTTRQEYSSYEPEGIFGDFNPFSNADTGMAIGVTISSFVIACLVFIFLIQKKKAPKGRFMRWLREFLNFRSIMIAGIIKFVYVFLAVALTITSVIVMFQGRDDTVLVMILSGLAMLIIGNIILRITMEMMMAIISMWDNTSDIRGVLVKEEEKPVEKTPKEPKIEKDIEAPVEKQPVVDSEVIAKQPAEVQRVETQPAQVAQPGPKSPGVAPKTLR